MGEIRGEEGWISLGPWGRTNDGQDWAYMPKGPIMHITISHDHAMIRSILFESKSCDGVFGSSAKIGSCATIHDVIRTFCINSSVEQLSSISLTHESFLGSHWVVSLCFETNIGNKYGPFGPGTNGSFVSIPVEGGVTTGFHGRVDKYLLTIGIFVAPKVNSLHPIQDLDYAPNQFKGKISYEGEWISLGPWEGEDGVDWAYKPNGPIMQISICYGEAIHSILFQTRSSDGFVISSKKIGSTGGNLIKMFCIDSSIEQLWSISLTYGDYHGQVIITSLCLETNIGNKYGPFGSRSGASSLSIPIEGGIIVEFHGCGGIGSCLTVDALTHLDFNEDERSRRRTPY